MGEAATPKRRKARLVRDEPPAGNALVVLRAAAADRERTIRNAVEDALDSGATYVVLHPDGRREVLYGISVFAQRPGLGPEEVLRRFPLSPLFITVTVGDLRHAGFEVLPTGSNPDHYDVQLLPGRFEAVDLEAPVKDIRGAVMRFLLTAGELHPNPAYSGETPGPEDPG